MPVLDITSRRSSHSALAKYLDASSYRPFCAANSACVAKLSVESWMQSGSKSSHAACFSLSVNSSGRRVMSSSTSACFMTLSRCSASKHTRE